MSSLKERIDRLERDLLADPPRISAYRDLPFAILRYDPDEEWDLRRQVDLLVTRLGDEGKEAEVISLADLLWQAIDATEGIEAVVALEKREGFASAQAMVTQYLSDPDWETTLPDMVVARLDGLDPRRNVAFLIRAGALAPAIYHMSKLLDEMHERTQIMTILFYPGTLGGTTELRFMDSRQYETTGNYRVKIYD